jgi:hypothetical protein
MEENIEDQLLKKLRVKKFSVQMNETTLRDSEAVLMVYVRYIDKDRFVGEMLFCRKLISTSKSKDIYNLFKNFLMVN